MLLAARGIVPHDRPRRMRIRTFGGGRQF